MKARVRAVVAAVALAAGLLLGASAPSTATATPAPATAVTPGPHDDGAHPPLVTSRQAPAVHPHTAAAATAVELPGGGVEIRGLDLHDTTIKHFGDTYYMYGSMYACGFAWYAPPTPWCGFGVSSAPSLDGPWTTPKLLFDPNSQDPWAHRSWQETCGGTAQGCFNPRMLQRVGWGANDGTFVLWFNAPRHYSDTHANAYNVMGCQSAMGPCGPGVPNGSYNKPNLPICAGNGDFGMIERPNTRPAIVCSLPSAAQLNIEELDYNGANGDGIGARGIAVTDTEGPGGWWDDASGRYVVTYSAPDCGYCTGTGTGYATSPSLTSGWQVPTNVGFNPPSSGRRVVSAGTCGGQPRTVTLLDGQPYQVIDLWVSTATGAANRNQTAAATYVAPLTYTPTTRVAGDGQRWIPPVSFPCS